VPDEASRQRPPGPRATGSRARPAATPTQGLVDAILAEYAALRNEIDWLIKDAGQYQTYALGLIAVLPPAFALLLGTHRAWLAIPAIIIANSTFCLFGYLFFRSHQEVHVVAAYLKQVVRPRIRQLTGSDSVWDWEEYKAKANLDIQRSTWLGLLGNPRFVWLLRLHIFLLPAAVGIVAVSVILFRAWIVHRYSWFALSAIGLGAVVNAGMVAVLTLWFWSKGDLAKMLADGS
jgi:hypothetical protein